MRTNRLCDLVQMDEGSICCQTVSGQSQGGTGEEGSCRIVCCSDMIGAYSKWLKNCLNNGNN